MTTPADYPDWQTPAAHAAQIYTTGVPLYSKKSAVLSGQAISVSAGSEQVLPAKAMEQTGYEIKVSLTGTTADTVVQVICVWYDSATSTILEQQTWYVTGGPAGTPLGYYITGPVVGDQLQITITTTVAGGVSGSLSLYSNSRVHARHVIRGFDTVSNLNPPGPDATDVTADLLGQRVASSLAASGTDTTQLPAYNGRVQVRCLTSTGTSNMRLVVTAISGLVTQPVWDVFSDATGRINGYLWLPRSIVQIQMTNTATASATLRYTFSVAED